MRFEHKTISGGNFSGRFCNANQLEVVDVLCLLCAVRLGSGALQTVVDGFWRYERSGGHVSVPFIARQLRSLRQFVRTTEIFRGRVIEIHASTARKKR